MPFELYRGGSDVSAKEILILSPLVEALKNSFASSPETCCLFVGYECAGRQIDATLIRRDALINLEIKNYVAERLVADAQGNLIRFPQQDKIGDDGGLNPIAQVSQQNFALKNFIAEHQQKIFRIKEPLTSNDFDVCGFVVLRQLGGSDTSALASKSSFLKISDKDKIFTNSNSYSGRDYRDKEKKLQLPEDFGKMLASLLGLSPVSELVTRDSDFGIEGDLAIKKYIGGWNARIVSDVYVHRLTTEEKLLQPKNHLIVGAPGVGKSAMVETVIVEYLQKEPPSGMVFVLPVLLRLIGHEVILEKIAGETGQRKNSAKSLEAGDFWIIFDGLDEMTDFRSNLPNITDFIRGSARIASPSVSEEMFSMPTNIQRNLEGW